jgi:hypothetical protein
MSKFIVCIRCTDDEIFDHNIDDTDTEGSYDAEYEISVVRDDSFLKDTWGYHNGDDKILIYSGVFIGKHSEKLKQSMIKLAEEMAEYLNNNE